MNGLETLLAASLLVGSMAPMLGTSADRSNECLAMNMYHEARNQGTAGVLAVSAVVLNRVNDRRFPNTVCGVVEQGPTRASWQDPQVRYPLKNRCQFSWYCDGKGDILKEGRLWSESIDLANYVVERRDDLRDITDGATHYHATYIDAPRWTVQKKVMASIDQHIFYRQTGRFNL